MAAATTDRACTSSPTLVRSEPTGASYTSRMPSRTPLLGNPRICVREAPARNPPAQSGVTPYRLGEAVVVGLFGVLAAFQRQQLLHLGPDAGEGSALSRLETHRPGTGGPKVGPRLEGDRGRGKRETAGPGWAAPPCYGPAGRPGNPSSLCPVVQRFAGVLGPDRSTTVDALALNNIAIRRPNVIGPS